MTREVYEELHEELKQAETVIHRHSLQPRI